MSERLWIGNVLPEASDEELVGLVKKYCGRESRVVERVHADNSKPGRDLEFAGLPLGELDGIAQRIAGLYWKGCALTVYHLLLDGSAPPTLVLGRQSPHRRA